MAEATTATKDVDLSNIEELVSASQISELTKNRNCLVHAMDSYDILQVLWKLVSHLPLMQMHRMYGNEEIFKAGWMHSQKTGREKLALPDDRKQKMILCPVYLPLKTKFPGKNFFERNEDAYMEPLRAHKKMVNGGMLEQYILVDRDCHFHVLEVYWETDEEKSSRPHYEYQGCRQINCLSLKEVTDVKQLHDVLGRDETVTFFFCAAKHLQQVLYASLKPARREYEKSVGVAGGGDQLKYEKYLTMVRAMNLFQQVRNQVQHRYGSR